MFYFFLLSIHFQIKHFLTDYVLPPQIRYHRRGQRTCLDSLRFGSAQFNYFNDGFAEKFPLLGYNLQFAIVYSKYYSAKVYYTLSTILDNEFE